MPKTFVLFERFVFKEKIHPCAKNSNIHEHQLAYIRKVIKHQGIVFLIVRFNNLHKDFIIPGNNLINYVDNTERKSIPLDYFENNCYKLDIKYAPRLDYIKIVDKLINEIEK